MNELVCEECGGRGEILDAPANVLDGTAYWEKCSVCKGTGKKPDVSVEFTVSLGHLINTYKKCPQCEGTDFYVANYNMMWHEGDVMCKKCGIRVRGYDAG